MLGYVMLHYIRLGYISLSLITLLHFIVPALYFSAYKVSYISK